MTTIIVIHPHGHNAEVLITESAGDGASIGTRQTLDPHSETRFAVYGGRQITVLETDGWAPPPEPVDAGVLTPKILALRAAELRQFRAGLDLDAARARFDDAERAWIAADQALRRDLRLAVAGPSPPPPPPPPADVAESPL